VFHFNEMSNLLVGLKTFLLLLSLHLFMVSKFSPQNSKFMYKLRYLTLIFYFFLYLFYLFYTNFWALQQVELIESKLNRRNSKQPMNQFCFLSSLFLNIEGEILLRGLDLKHPEFGV
jgi:hypothetical protein